MSTTITPSKTRVNWTYVLVATIVRTFMIGAAAISFSHIVATSHALGLGWEAWTVPGFVDGLAVLGLVGRSARFAPSTQRAGLRLMTGAGLLSLACNVYAGHNLGQRLYGVLVVAGFITAEWYSAKLRPAAVPVPTVSEKRSDAARRGAETAKANRERKAAEALKAQAERDRKTAERREARRLAVQVAELEGVFSAADAPVSPAA